MTIYKANKYYTTMNFNTFIMLGTDEDILNKAHELQMKLFNDSRTENYDELDKFIKENGLIYIDDVTDEIDFGYLDDQHECAIFNNQAYIYQIINNYEDRF